MHTASVSGYTGIPDNCLHLSEYSFCFVFIDTGFHGGYNDIRISRIDTIINGSGSVSVDAITGQ